MEFHEVSFSNLTSISNKDEITLKKQGNVHHFSCNILFVIYIYI